MRSIVITHTWVVCVSLAFSLALAAVAPLRARAATQETRFAGREVVRVEAAEAERMAAEGKTPFSEERLEQLQDREASARELEDYQGGVAIVIGSTVLLVALAVVLIIVLVD